MAKQSKQRAFEDAKDRAIAAGICVADVVKVISFDEAAMTVNVQPTVRYPDEDTFQSKPQILSVPVALVFGGGFVFRPVYKSGDIGVVLYLDRDSDAALAGGSESNPNTERLHSGDDAVFVGGIRAGTAKISGLPPGTLCAGTDTGSVFAAIGADGITIKGNIQITGNVDVTGSVAATTDVTASGVSLKSHTHTGDSGGTTSSPQ